MKSARNPSSSGTSAVYRPTPPAGRRSWRRPSTAGSRPPPSSRPRARLCAWSGTAARARAHRPASVRVQWRHERTYFHGVKIVEIASIGPGPFAAMLLADLGADVIRIDRPAARAARSATGPWNFMHRGRRVGGGRPQAPRGRASWCCGSCERADALIEGFRPGVMERLGLGPDECLARNPRLVYGRMTATARTARWRRVAGHDINYIALAGVLGAIGAGGRAGRCSRSTSSATSAAAGCCSRSAWSARSSRRARPGTGRSSTPRWSTARRCCRRCSTRCAARACGPTSAGTNLLDSGAHFYEVYETADGGHVAVGALEPQFYAELLRLLELDPADFPQMGPGALAGAQAALRRGLRHPHARRVGGAARARRGLRDGGARAATRRRSTRTTSPAARSSRSTALQPAPAPRFSRTPAAISRPAGRARRRHRRRRWRDWGIDDVAALRAAGAVSGPAGDSDGTCSRNSSARSASIRARRGAPASRITVLITAANGTARIAPTTPSSVPAISTATIVVNGSARPPGGRRSGRRCSSRPAGRSAGSRA